MIYSQTTEGNVSDPRLYFSLFNRKLFYSFAGPFKSTNMSWKRAPMETSTNTSKLI